MTYSGPIEDRLAVRELIEAYSDAVARRDADAWEQTWTQDAVWDLAGHIVEGREAILQTWLGAMSTFEFVAFYATPGAIEIIGDKAQARVWVSEVLIPKGEPLKHVQGAYEDELSKDNGIWKFTKRSYRILHDTSAHTGG